MARGARGESTIVRGEDGRWHGYVSMGLKAGGERDRRHVAAVKRADVVAAVRRLEEQRRYGRPRRRTRHDRGSVDDAVAGHHREPENPAEHGGRYRSWLKRIVLQLGHHRLDRLQPEHLEAFYANLEKEVWRAPPS